MNKLTSHQRKLVYLVGMGLLFIPVITLGFPAAQSRKQAGGVLAQMRQANDLGESTLGNVDPSSATMNLVLLGLRGPAACMLWVQMDKQKDAKDWAGMRATTESIIKLQPHFQKVWQFHAWNLAYNVSVEWDSVKDRYFWVKEGAKFYRKGSQRNDKYPELYWYFSDTIGKKIGRSDEWRQFRRYFRVDPDTERFSPNGVPGPDTELNPNNEDNYAVSARWFTETNRIMDTYGKEQHIMDKSLFRSYPGRSMIDHASSLQKEGHFDEETREIWAKAFLEWKNVYGQETWKPAPQIDIHLAWTKEEIQEFVKNSPLPEGYKGGKKQYEIDLRSWVGRYQNMTNFRYWHDKCYSEQQKNTVQAHKELYDALAALASGDTQEAERLAYTGLQKYEKVIGDAIAGAGLRDDDLAIEEGMLGILTWRSALELGNKPIPNDFPLRNMWLAHQNRLKEIEAEFKRRISPTRNN